VSTQKPLPRLVSKFGRTVFTISGESPCSGAHHFISNHKMFVRFAVLTPVTEEWDMMSSNLVDDFKIFGGTCQLHHQTGRASRAVTQAAHACLLVRVSLPSWRWSSTYFRNAGRFLLY
jgi:hypothetical protein